METARTKCDTKRARIVFTPVLMLLVLTIGACVLADESGQKTTYLSDGPIAGPPVGTWDPRAVATTREIPSRTGAPVIAVAKMREVWYIDSGDGSVLRKYVFDAPTGCELWSWKYESGRLGRADMGLTSEGAVFLLALENSESRAPLNPYLMLIGDKVTEGAAMTADLIDPQRRVALGTVDDGSVSWVLQNEEMELIWPGSDGRLSAGGLR